MGKGEAGQAGQLQHVLLVLGAVTLGLLVGLIVLAVTEPAKEDDGFCNTDSCVTLAAELKSLSNTSLDPCDSFAQYACAGWISRVIATETEGVNSRFVTGTPRIQARIRRILDGPLANEAQPVPRSLALARGFFQSCKDTARQDVDGDLHVKRALNQWFAEPLTEQNLPDAILNISIFAGAYPFFHINTFGTANERVTFSIRGGSRPSPNDSPSSSSRQVNRAARLPYLREVFQLLDIDPGLVEAVEGIDTWLERELASSANQVILDTMGELDQRFNRYFPFLLIVQNLLQGGTSIQQEAATTESPVIVYGSSHLLRVGQYLSNMTRSNNAALVAFMKFKAVRPFLPFMGQAYRNAAQQFAIASGDQPTLTSATAIATSCQATTYRYFRGVLTLMYFRHFSEGQAAITEGRAMFDHMKVDMKAVINDMTYATDADKQLLNGKVDNMELSIGVGQYQSSFTHLDRLYTVMGDNVTCFTCSLGEATFALQRSTLPSLGAVFQVADVDTDQLAVNALYDPGENYVVLLLGMLEEPLYATTANYLYKYSRFGVLFAHEIGHGFDPSNILVVFPASQQMQQFSAGFLAMYGDRRQCLANYYNRYMVHHVTVNGTITLGENVADIIGLDVALRTYRRLFASADRSLPEMSSMSRDQQFFLSHAQSQCAKVNMIAAEGLRFNPHAPDLVRIDGPFSQSREFAKAFNCKAGTRMNPAQKCDLF